MKFRAQLALSQLRERWMVESTKVLWATAELGELAADVLLYKSKRLHRFTQERFMDYTRELRETYDDEVSAQQPTGEPEFSDPQHGAEEESHGP